VEVFSSSEGEQYVQLGQKKRVTVREFKGEPQQFISTYNNVVNKQQARFLLIFVNFMVKTRTKNQERKAFA